MTQPADRYLPPYPPEASDVLRDDSASFWLKSALRQALARDPVDAMNDAETLADILRARLDAQLNTGRSA